MVKKRNLTKEKIAATVRLLAKDVGIQKVTFQNLAEVLDIKYPSLYNHFRNMSELKLYLTDLLIKELNGQLLEKLEGKMAGDAIMAYAEAYRTFAIENEAVYELLISIPQTKNQELLNEMYQTTDIIQEILTPYHLSEEERIHRSRELRSLTHGSVTLTFLGYFKKGSQVSAEKSYFWMIKDFIYSLERSEEKRKENSKMKRDYLQV